MSLLCGLRFPQQSWYWRSHSQPGCGAITDDPWNSGYKTSTVAPEPSVERVAEAGRLSDGRIDNHMTLQGPLLDSKI
jgi:hypothetical protein